MKITKANGKSEYALIESLKKEAAKQIRKSLILLHPLFRV